MKAHLFLFVLAGVLQSSSIAQNVLEPCREDFSDEYHARVNRIIGDAVAQPSSLRLTTFPSFQPESGLILVGAELYFVRLNSFYWAESLYADRDGSYRRDFVKPKIVTTTLHAPLSATIARRIEYVYSAAIAKAGTSGRMGLDGVAYVFSTSNGACAWAWSPEPGTRNGRLLELMERLEKHATFSLPIDLQRSEKAIKKLLQTIEDN
jgi:hypothetical protein